MSRARRWFDRLAAGGVPVANLPPSVRAADVVMQGHPVRIVAVVPDANARFARARAGEVGIDEGYALARAVREAPERSALLAIVDVPGQAFGVREEAIGLQRALAAAVEAYVERRRAGTQVLALIVGKAISGAFLAHGMQAGWIAALRDPAIEVHVMSEAATARVTRMCADEIARLAGEIPATSRRVEDFARFGAIDALFDVDDPCEPSAAQLDAILTAIGDALEARKGTRAPTERLATAQAAQTRALARRVRDAIDAAWDA